MKEKILDDTEPGHKGPNHQSDLDLSVISIRLLSIYYRNNNLFAFSFSTRFGSKTHE